MGGHGQGSHRQQDGGGTTDSKMVVREGVEHGSKAQHPVVPPLVARLGVWHVALKEEEGAGNGLMYLFFPLRH